MFYHNISFDYLVIQEWGWAC